VGELAYYSSQKKAPVIPEDVTTVQRTLTFMVVALTAAGWEIGQYLTREPGKRKHSAEQKGSAGQHPQGGQMPPPSLSSSQELIAE